MKDMNRKVEKEKYSNPSHQPFKLLTLERPTNIDGIRMEINKEQSKHLTFKTPSAKPVPKLPPAEVLT